MTLLYIYLSVCVGYWIGVYFERKRMLKGLAEIQISVKQQRRRLDWILKNLK